MLKALKKVIFLFWLLLLIGATCWGDTPSLTEEPIIADHTIVDQYDKIPKQYIDIVKSYWVQLLGESHSKAYRDGLVLLEAQNALFQAEIQQVNDPNPPLPQTDDYLRMSLIRRSGSGWASWTMGENIFWTTQAGIDSIKANVTYCNTHNLPIKVVGFGWCWDMTRGAEETCSPSPDPVYGCHWYGSTDGKSTGWWGLDEGDSPINCKTYCEQIDDYNKFCQLNNYITKFIFTTGTVDNYKGESGYQGFLKNQYIRDYVKKNGGVLFDYADILCYNDEGALQETKWSDIGYQIIHPDNDTEDTGHISNAGAIRLAKAMWWMLARLAGWDGKTEPDLTPPEVVSVGANSVTAVDIVFNEKVTAETATNINNYVISGGDISVYQAVLDTAETSTKVTLTTSSHQDGTYNIIITGIKDQTGNMMNPPRSYNYNVGTYDTTPPSAVSQVNDGLGADISHINSATTISANWIDTQSGIVKYWYAIGTSPGGTDLVNWTDNGNNLSVTVTITEPKLIDSRIYYVSVKAEKSNGLQSTWISSNGQTVDLTPPVISNLTTVNITSSGAMISWATNESATSLVEYGLTPEYGLTVTTNNQLITEHKVSLTGLVTSTQYFYRVTVTDAAGNPSTSESSFTTSTNQFLNNGLVAYWKFDEEAGAIAIDSSTNGIKAQLGVEPKAPVRCAGKIGNGLLFDGVNDEVIVPTNQALQLIGSRTISFWVEPKSLKTFNMIYGDSNSDYLGFDVNGYLRIWWRDRDNGQVSILEPKAKVTVGVWTFYAITFEVIDNLVTVKIYQDGVLVNPEPYQNLNLINQLKNGITPYQIKYIGARNSYGANILDGALDEFRIHNRALSLAEINELFKGTPEDITRPSAVTQVNDGLSADADISHTNSVDTLSASWGPASDPDSGIAKYWYAIGTNPGSTDLLNWTNNGNNLSVTVTGLSLTENQTYYVSVKAENGSGLPSDSKSSDGQKVDLVPVISNLETANITSGDAEIGWVTNEPVTSQFEYGLTPEYGLMVPVSSQPTTVHKVSLNGLLSITQYFYRVTVTDAVGNTGIFEGSFTTSDVTPPAETYTLNITAVNGVVTKNPDRMQYEENSLVELRAIPNPCYEFSSWTGGVTGSQNPVTVNMNSDKTITANFVVFLPLGVKVRKNAKNSVLLEWSTSEVGVMEYRIYRNSQLINRTTERTYTDSNLPAGSYSYQVSAVSADGLRESALTVPTAPIVVANQPTQVSEIYVGSWETDFEVLTEADLELIASKKIMIGGRSFCQNIRRGLARLYSGLANPENGFTEIARNLTNNNQRRPSDGDLETDYFDKFNFLQYVCSFSPRTARIDEFSSFFTGTPYYNSGVTYDFHDDVDIAILEIEADEDESGANGYQNVYEKYRDTMTKLQADYPNTTFIFFSHYLYFDKLDTSWGTFNRTSKKFNNLLFNEMLGKVPIYDFADILSTRPDGEICTEVYSTDNQVYRLICPEYNNGLEGVPSHPNTDFIEKRLGKGLALLLKKVIELKSAPDKDDIAAPVVTEIQVPEITVSEATISWKTNEPSTSRVEYGLSTEYGSTLTSSIQPVIEHTVKLSGLIPGSQYHFRIIATDVAGNTSTADSSFGTLTGQNMDEGLVAYWKFDEGSGTDIIDSSVNHYNGVLKEPAQWVTGHQGSGVLLNNNYINLGSSNFGLTNEVTISAWVMLNSDTGTNQVLIQRGQYVYPFSIFFKRYNSNNSWIINAGIRTNGVKGTYYAASDYRFDPISANQWYHIVMTYQNGALIVYLNGTEVARNNEALGNFVFGSATSDTYIGADPGGQTISGFFNGIVDEVRTYNRALTEAEVVQLNKFTN